MLLFREWDVVVIDHKPFSVSFDLTSCDPVSRLQSETDDRPTRQPQQGGTP